MIHHRYAEVGGRRIFYRESGDPAALTVVLLHGYPSSSFYFRDLIPRLSGRYHVVAPDHLGFGFSDTPPVEDFAYTFDALAEVTAAFLAQMNIDRFVMYVHDYGAPIGWRLAVANPSQVAGIISQNGNAYTEGFVKDFWAPIWDFGRDPTPEREGAIRGALSLEVIRWMYVTGELDESLVSPEAWLRDHHLLSRPGVDCVQLALFGNYLSNVAQYARLHEYFRTVGVPLLAVWGSGDPTFRPDGARAFLADLPHAQVHLLKAGHFALESSLEEITSLVLDFVAGLERGHV